MDKKIKQFEVFSPDELREGLANYEKDGPYFACVRVFGPHILTRQFNFPNSSAKDLLAGLKLEASEILSVNTFDVEMSYQITATDEQGVHGILLAMPRHLLMEYLDCFKASPLVPISLTASAVGAVKDFLKDQVLPADNFCLVNFLKSHAVNIIIFANGKPTFFRELYDLSDSDFKDKVTDTIRYSCSQSASKSINQIFFTGDLKDKDVLIKDLKGLDNFSSAKPVSSETVLWADHINLDLLNNYALGLVERARLIFIFSLISVISIIVGIFLLWQLSNVYSQSHNASVKIKMSDYYQALDLQEQVRHMNHE